MPNDPVLIEETKSWLKKAKLDLKTAEHSLTSDQPLTEIALFHCQQSVEKSLKAFLTFHQTVFRKTHLIEEIGQQCIKIDSSLSGVISKAVPLTEYVSKYRYPGEIEEPELQEAQDAIQITKEVYNVIFSKIPKS